MPASDALVQASPRRRIIRTAGNWLRLALGLALLGLSLREINWSQLAGHLSAVHPAWLAVGLLSVLISMGLKILRWDVLLGGCGLSARPHLLRLGGAYLLGQAANILLPFRGGEVVRIGWLAVEDRQDTLLAAISVFVEKYLDLAALVLLSLWLGPTLPIDAVERSRGWLIPLCAALSVILVAGLWLGPRLWAPVRKWLDGHLRGRWTERLARVDHWVKNVQMLRSMRVVVPAIVLTGLVWLCMLATNLLVLHSLGLDADARAGGLVLALVYLGVAPALMPGNFGPFYFFAMLGLTPFGIPEAERGAFAVLLHALVTLPPLLLAGGFISASRWIKRGSR